MLFIVSERMTDRSCGKIDALNDRDLENKTAIMNYFPNENKVSKHTWKLQEKRVSFVCEASRLSMYVTVVEPRANKAPGKWDPVSLTFGPALSARLGGVQSTETSFWAKM